MVIRPKAYASDIYPIQPSSAYERNKKYATSLQQCNYCTSVLRQRMIKLIQETYKERRKRKYGTKISRIDT